MPARALKPRKAVWRADAARIARGPKRAPERYDTAVSKGTPRMAMSKSDALSVEGMVRHLWCGRCANVLMPLNPQSVPHLASRSSAVSLWRLARVSCMA